MTWLGSAPAAKAASASGVVEMSSMIPSNWPGAVMSVLRHPVRGAAGFFVVEVHRRELFVTRSVDEGVADDVELSARRVVVHERVLAVVHDAVDQLDGPAGQGGTARIVVSEQHVVHREPRAVGTCDQSVVVRLTLAGRVRLLDRGPLHRRRRGDSSYMSSVSSLPHDSER